MVTVHWTVQTKTIKSWTELCKQKHWTVQTMSWTAFQKKMNWTVQTREIKNKKLNWTVQTMNWSAFKKTMNWVQTKKLKKYKLNWTVQNRKLKNICGERPSDLQSDGLPTELSSLWYANLKVNYLTKVSRKWQCCAPEYWPPLVANLPRTGTRLCLICGT